MIQALDRPYLLPYVVAVVYVARFSVVVVVAAAQSTRPLVIWSGFPSSSSVSFPSAASVKSHAQFWSEFLPSSKNIGSQEKDIATTNFSYHSHHSRISPLDILLWEVSAPFGIRKFGDAIH